MSQSVPEIRDVTLRLHGGDLEIGVSDVEVWSTSPTVCPAAEWTDMFNYIFDPWGEREFSIWELRWLYFYIKYRVYRITLGTTIQERIRARNEGGTWVLISDESVAADPGATPGVEKITSGYVLPVTNFDSVPFEVAVQINPSVVDDGRLQVSSFSYARSVYKMR